MCWAVLRDEQSFPEGTPQSSGLLHFLYLRHYFLEVRFHALLEGHEGIGARTTGSGESDLDHTILAHGHKLYISTIGLQGWTHILYRRFHFFEQHCSLLYAT